MLALIKYFAYFFLFLFLFLRSSAQETPVRVDSLPLKDSPMVANKAAVDSVMRVHSPGKAAFRSAVLPGWGQIYNKKYWKLPLVYGALGITGGVFIYNLKEYRKLRFAYSARRSGDATLIAQIDPTLVRLDDEAIRTYRDEFRSNIDYSVLFFLIFWGLNVVDAAVDAHLKSFDVSPDLSFKIKMGHSNLGNTHGLSLILAFK